MSYNVSFNFSVTLNEFTKPIVQQALPFADLDMLSVITLSTDPIHYSFKNVYGTIQLRAHSKSVPDDNFTYLKIRELCKSGSLDISSYGFISIEVDAENDSSLISCGWLPVGSISFKLETPEHFM